MTNVTFWQEYFFKINKMFLAKIKKTNWKRKYIIKKIENISPLLSSKKIFILFFNFFFTNFHLFRFDFRSSVLEQSTARSNGGRKATNKVHSGEITDASLQFFFFF